jgi:hypothetical protein
MNNKRKRKKIKKLKKKALGRLILIAMYWRLILITL